MGLPHPATGFTHVGSVSHAQLFLGGKEVIYSKETLLKDATITENLRPGTVLGMVTAAGADFGKLRVCAAANGDGSENPYAILSDEVDFALLNAEDVQMQVVTECEMNPDLVTVGAGHTVDGLKNALRNIGILLHTVY